MPNGLRFNVEEEGRSFEQVKYGGDNMIPIVFMAGGHDILLIHLFHIYYID